MKASYNTKKRGLLRFIVFQEKDKDYKAVCLDLNIIEYGKDPDKLIDSIVEAAHSLINGVIKNKLPDKVLNNPASLKYWKIAERSKYIVQKKPKINPIFLNTLAKPYTFKSLQN